MKHLNAYSTVCGELPKMCSEGRPMVMVSMSELVDFKNSLVNIFSDTHHTAYENKCYANFLLRKIGLNHEIF